MSNLEQLIQEFCPDGVEYCKLVDVCNILYGYPCDATKFNDNRMGLPLVRIRDVLAGKTTTYTTEKVPQEYIIQAGDLLVGMDGNFHVSNWKDNCGVLCQRVCRISSKDETMVLNGFLRHYLPPTIKQIELSKPSGTVKHLLAKDINAIYVPLPPLPVQQEIVRILDTFTELTAELNEKLTAELAARKKQYEYYRDELLHKSSFRDVRVCKLGEVANIHTGSKPAEILEDYSEFEYINAGTSNSGYVKTPNSPGDTVTTPSRGQGGIGFVGYQSRPFHLGPLCYSIRSNDENIVTNKFIYYWLSSHAGDILAFKKEGGTPALNRGDLMGLRLCVPHISVQHRIVSILDRFDALCNDLTSGLPAEMEARRKQYEYYRDKLLSFKVKA